MNNDIKETYCSFEVSKLLKEKGFDVYCRSCYELALTTQIDEETGLPSGAFGWKEGELHIETHYANNSSLPGGNNWYCCSRPLHSIVIEWLRVNFGWYITIEAILDEFDMLEGFNVMVYRHWRDKVEHQLDILKSNKPISTFTTPIEATEAALLKILNQIK